MLVRPEDLPQWVPGRSMIPADAGQWDGIEVRAYQYGPLQVSLPPLRDFMIIAFKKPTSIRRRFDGAWRSEFLNAGECSLLNKGEHSEWRWPSELENTLLYVRQEALAGIAAEVFDRDIQDLHFLDMLKVQDASLRYAAQILEDEACHRRPGETLLVEGITNSLCVHLLRNYCSCSFRTPAAPGTLPLSQARRITEYIEEHLADSLSLAELAKVAGVSQHHFYRQFRSRFGCPPHAYVTQQRLERAKALIARTHLPLKEVAAASGFCDQSHMTRLFRQHLGITPKSLQQSPRR